MQLRHALTAFLFALCCADTVVGRHVVQQRRDTTSPAPTHTTASSAKNTPSPTHTGSDHASTHQTSLKGSHTTHGDATSKVTTHTHSQTGVSAGHKNATASADEQLPIQPKITPALGIVGVIFILTGIAYTIIGIKHKWMLVFLSTAYLASLGVTVLIIYLMHPPVSDAIQGAYFVAAFFTGVIFGGLALIFQEVAEGFGCLVGGFCLAMWFLCLSPGGLITSTTGKAIMIGVFSAVAWSLSFSKYTRNYGSIFCSSFAGATVTMLGVDCFSRAGLKEFWIYIWNLNPNEFPLHTTTYPITRGIRAELAGIVIIFLLGIVSQLKVWKLVKERRAKKEAIRLEDETSRDQRDSRIGKQIEARNSKALAQWEAFYGDKEAKPLPGDSAVGTSSDSFKRSTSVTEREIDAVELEDLTKDTGKQPQASVIYTGASEADEIRPAPALKLDIDNNSNSEYSWWADFKSTKSARTQSKKDSIESSRLEMASPPPVVPLPLPATTRSDEEASLDEKSVANQDAADVPVNERRGVPLKKLNLGKVDEVDPVPLEDDRASSVAATADEEPDFDALSTKRLSMPMSVHNTEGLSPFSDHFRESDDEKLEQPAQKGQDEESTKDTSNEPVITELKDGNLPDSISKVAMTYRTNEWAKHIADAEQPDAPEIVDTEEPGVQVDVGRPKEAPRPLDTKALAPQPKYPKSPTSPTIAYRSSTQGLSRRASGGIPIYSSQRQSSSASVNQVHQVKRRSSAPLNQQSLTESPIEEDVALTNNLLDERNGRLERKPTTINFNGIDAIPSSAFAASEAAQTPDSELAENTITLAQRKSLLQGPNPNHNRTSHLQRRESASNKLIYDSHQPRRTPTADKLKQNAMLTQWRQSLQQEAQGAQQPTALYEQQARQSMVDQLRYSQYQGAKQDSARKNRESKMDVAMRTGQLTSKHKEAMRKMQAKADV